MLLGEAFEGSKRLCAYQFVARLALIDTQAVKESNPVYIQDLVTSVLEMALDPQSLQKSSKRLLYTRLNGESSQSARHASSTAHRAPPDSFRAWARCA